jgi:hypothetical protein
MITETSLSGAKPNILIVKADAATKDIPIIFKMESSARSKSPAEPLGLAPVAAYSIILAFGGEM